VSRVLAIAYEFIHRSAEQLRSEGNPEHPGWENWEQALSAALINVEGAEEFENLLDSQ
jgi:hypothetical protein